MDEAQYETSKNLVKFKMFKTEDEAKEFKKEHKDWSDISHSERGYYCAYCKPGVMAVEAVREAGEYYNLNVELTAGYIVGYNWRSCH